MSEQVLLVEHEGPVAVVTLNRPRAKNALAFSCSLPFEGTASTREPPAAVSAEPVMACVSLTAVFLPPEPPG